MQVVHRIHVDCLSRQAAIERVDERLAGRANTGCLIRAAGEHDFDAGTRVIGRKRLCRLAGAASEPTRIPATASAAKIADSASSDGRPAHSDYQGCDVAHDLGPLPCSRPLSLQCLSGACPLQVGPGSAIPGNQ